MTKHLYLSPSLEKPGRVEILILFQDFTANTLACISLFQSSELAAQVLGLPFGPLLGCLITKHTSQ